MRIPLRVGRSALFRPFAHVGDGARRAVAVEDDQRQALGGERLLHAGQRFRRLPGEDADRRVVATGLAAQEIFQCRHSGCPGGSRDRHRRGGQSRRARSIGAWQAERRARQSSKATKSQCLESPDAFYSTNTFTLAARPGGVDHGQRRIAGAVRQPGRGAAAVDADERLAVGQPAERRAAALQLQHQRRGVGRIGAPSSTRAPSGGKMIVRRRLGRASPAPARRRRRRSAPASPAGPRAWA